MLPVIQPGAVLTVEPGDFSAQNPAAGELVVFRRGEELVCHRFYGSIRIGLRRYGIEKGDHNQIAGLFRSEEYIGRLISVDKTPAGELFHTVQKTSVLTLMWGLIRERWAWIHRKFSGV